MVRSRPKNLARICSFVCGFNSQLMKSPEFLILCCDYYTFYYDFIIKKKTIKHVGCSFRIYNSSLRRAMIQSQLIESLNQVVVMRKNLASKLLETSKNGTKVSRQNVSEAHENKTSCLKQETSCFSENVCTVNLQYI